MKYCSKTGKHIHMERTKAVTQLRSIKRDKPNYSGRVFFCTGCKGFHVGRLQKTKKRKAKDPHKSSYKHHT